MRRILVFLLLVLLALHSISQNYWENYFDEGGGERYFRFTYDSQQQLEKISSVISIDQVVGESVVAWANKKGFEAFLKLGLAYEFIPLDCGFEPVMHDLSELDMLRQWNSYPTYEAYEAMMYQFQTDHASKCTVHNIKTLNSGRKLLGVQINVNDEPKPQFLYSATMHGDEIAGYVLSLRLIDYLLTQYGTNPFVTRLVDSVEIWIFPNTNPDGTYFGGNHTVMNSRRGNANNIDLNRNFPDPKAGPNPDGNPWQPENIAMMELAEDNRFTMGANMHGGAEVCNYPWDTWQRLTADNSWWVLVCREYADTAQFFSPPGYMSQFNSGITNGYAWYSITGGRQDYMNFFHGCREFTLELSNVKKLPANQLDAHWEYNYRSFLNYIEQSLYGVRGIITDAATGEPVEAKVYISGHDIDSSHVYSAKLHGNYHRFLIAGNYNITFSSPCHYPVTINNVTVQNRQTTWLDVSLTPLPAQAIFEASQTMINPEQAVSFSDLSCGAIEEWNWSFPGAIPSFSNSKNPVVIYPVPGEFDVQLIVYDGVVSDTLYKENYITVAPAALMANKTETTCFAFFYDSGGPNRNYNNNENFVMTFVPQVENSMIVAEFKYLDIESSFNCNSDYLKIYNGMNTSAPLIGTYCGTNSPGLVTATNPDGALTFHFRSDGSVNRSGWEAIIRCLYPEAPPIPDFTANITNVYTGDTVYFFDLTAGDVTSWNWIFEGGIPEQSYLQFPVVVYPVQGIYQVSLEVTNAFGSEMLVMEDYITVDSGVGMVRIDLNPGVIIYPNPVSNGLINIKSDDILERVMIYNLMGQELGSFEPFSKNHIVDASMLRAGVYFLKMQTRKGTVIRKIQVL